MSEWLTSAQRKCDEYRELMLELQNAGTSMGIPLTGEQVLLVLRLDQQGRCTVKNMPYNGTNASYNVKKLTDMELVNYEVAAEDHRVRYVSLTDKGERLAREIIRHFEDGRAAA